MLNIYILFPPEFIQPCYHYIPLLLMKNAPMLSIGTYLILFPCTIKLCLPTQQYSDQISMAKEHKLLISYTITWMQHSQWVWHRPSFTHTDYLVIQGWICATSLYPDTINQDKATC